MSFFDLKGKTAFVTGASSSLGKGFAQTLAGAGAKIFSNSPRFRWSHSFSCFQ